MSFSPNTPNVHNAKTNNHISRSPSSYPSAKILFLRGGADTSEENDTQKHSEEPNHYANYEEELFVEHSTPPRPMIEMPDSNTLDPSPPKVGLLFMDNFSPYHGQYLSYMARTAYKVGVVNVLSGYMAYGLTDTNTNINTNIEDSSREEQEDDLFDYATMRIPDVGSEKEWAENIPFEIVGIYCESDSGLPSAERLGVALGLHPDRHDGINRARRDKFLMNEAMKKHGLNTVQQKLCHSLEETREFAQHVCEISTSEEEEETDSTKKSRVVLKPTRGVASDNVHLCSNLNQVKKAFEEIHQTEIFGSPHQQHEYVLAQEFARGTEYAIDIVSKNGHHKVAALWKYDKRTVNGAPFVYHATVLEDPNESDEGMEACQYAKKALDALNLKWGLSHIEVVVNSEQKKNYLIEVNCRQHNTDFAPMTSVCIGYNALDMVLSAYLGDYVNEDDFEEIEEGIRLDWDLLPDFPSARICGAVIHLVCHVEGKVCSIQGLEELENLESVRNYKIYDEFEVGCEVSETIDIRTDAGWVHLMHDDYDQFWSDYKKIMNLMEEMFVVE